MDFIEKKVISNDGIEIVYYDSEVGDKGTILICNGLGGFLECWSKIFPYFTKGYRVVSWDYRGLYKSEKPTDFNKLTLNDITDDGVKIIEKENLDNLIIMGWSLGVQIALELHKKVKSKIKGYILISGPYQYLIKNGVRVSFLEQPAYKLVSLLQKYDKIYSKGLNLLTSIPNLGKILKLLHFSKVEDDQFFEKIVKKYVSQDMGVSLEIVKKANKVSSFDILKDIKVPTLVVGATADIFSPLKDAKTIAKNIKNSKLIVVKGGTHYAVMEFPKYIGKKINKFLNQRVN